MELQEAIDHAREVTTRENVCESCREEHGQLADWLEELKSIREILGDCDLDRLRVLVTAYKEGRYIIMRDAEQEGVARLRELSEADRDGRCVVLPCKVGDVLYSAFPLCGVNKHQVRKFERNSEGDFACSALMIPFSDFGKRVFLTREEAEAALKGERDG